MKLKTILFWFIFWFIPFVFTYEKNRSSVVLEREYEGFFPWVDERKIPYPVIIYNNSSQYISVGQTIMPWRALWSWHLSVGKTKVFWGGRDHGGDGYVFIRGT